MNRISLGAFVGCLLLVLNISAAEPSKKVAKTVTMPLDKIWAHNKMPGTRDINELDSEHKKVTGKALLDPISVSWVLRAEKMKWENLARPGFAVKGTGVAALVAANSVFVEGKKPQSTFSSTDDITLVFFSEPVGGVRVRLHSVTRQGGTIRIQYELDQIIGGSRSLNLALIPLGKIADGTYRVEFTQVLSGKASDDANFKPMNLDPDWHRRYQCQRFEFRVTDTGGVSKRFGGNDDAQATLAKHRDRGFNFASPVAGK